jgi:hypothetical protein
MDVDLRTPADISELFRNEIIEQSYLLLWKRKI